ncbi:hypothetical protein QJS66_02980 [Kocuria rhizophila]|nr:hypothetical protein QJS66_02980 [Kocuria rhizophila]
MLHFGIRRRAAAAIVDGIVMSRRPAPSGTFLIFSDYQRPAVRLGALMKVPSIYVWTHDSVGLGESSPRASPWSSCPRCARSRDSSVVRPADANETAVAWRAILESHEHPAGVASHAPGPAHAGQ